MVESEYNSDINYFCDRCEKITTGVFPELGADARTQIKGGLHISVEGYYEAFYDTFLDEEPDVIHFCHDCSLWLVREVEVLSERSKGGHPCNSESERCCEYAWSPEEETNLILNDEELMEALRESDKDIEEGNLVDFDNIEASAIQPGV